MWYQTLITIIYLAMVATLIFFIVKNMFADEKITNKITLSVLLVMWILRLLLIK